MTYRESDRRAAITFISMLLMLGAVLPAAAHAGVIADILSAVTGSVKADTITYPVATGSLQVIALPRPAMNLDPSPARGGGSITIVGGTALLPQEGPSGTIADIEKPADPTISTYIVQPGDTLSGIAAMFKVTSGTILSANDLPRNAVLQIGQQLVILPISGYQYTVKRGDTIASIAKRFGGDVTEIESYNNVDDTTLSVGSQIIIPNGEAAPMFATGKKPFNSGANGKLVGRILTGSHASCGKVVPDAYNPAEPSHNVGPDGTCAQIAYYIAPLRFYIQTQGIHGYNAVDLAAPENTPIMASANGRVIVARAGGWNGGYGSYVVIQHENGSQTLYAHMSRVSAYDGERVVQGQVIGYVGETGEATGPHVHFEIRNGIRNPF